MGESGQERPGRVTEVLAELRRDTPGARDELLQLVYGELWRLAEAQMRLWRGYMDLWATAARRVAGESASDEAVSPEKGDRRWASKDWTENPVFDVIKQSYLLTARWLEEMVEGADDVDEATKRKVRFFTRQLADAFSPTNFV